jgi:endo-1,4-beta-xylanase
LYSLATFPMGVGVNAGDDSNSLLNSSAQQDVVTTHFSQVTPGNIMKMSFLHPEENTFFYTDADKLVDYAKAHGLSVHGHTLIWHADYQVPSWMRNFTGDKTAWLAMLKKHVQTIASHFAGKVVSWDVVNEAIADGGGYTNTTFYQNTGVE